MASLARSEIGLVSELRGPISFLPRAEPATTRIVKRYRVLVAMPDLSIICVDCGGDCFPLNWRPEVGEVEPETIVAYRCRDCLDRWDVVVPDSNT